MRKAILTVCMCVLAITANGQNRSFEAKVDKYLAPYLQMKDFGGAVLVARNGKVLLRKGYGFANYEFGITNTAETKFQIASVSKTFTAAAIVMLEHEGRLGFKDPLSKFLPDFPSGDKIKISHLLVHSSGVPDFYSLPEYEELKTKPLTIADWIALIKTKPLDFEPGKPNGQNGYSNTGYALLALVIEKVSGQSYEDFLSDKIFKPLGMTNTGIWKDEAVMKNRASGYDPWFGSPGLINTPYYDKAVLFGSGSLYSTADDLYLWYKAVREGKLLKVDPVRPFGWGPRKRFNRELIEQDGNDPGFAANISAFLKDDLTVIVLSNIRTGAIDKIREDLAAIALDEKYEVPATRKTVQVPPEIYDDYVGRYELNPKMIITIKREGEHLFLKGTGGYFLPLEPLSNSKFFFRQFYVPIVFDRGQDGKINQFLWDGQFPVKKIGS